MKRSQVDEILSKVKKQASAVAKVRSILPNRKVDANNNGIPDDEEEYVPVGVKGLLSASQKLLAINRGLDAPDERDSLLFKRILTTDRLLSERVRLDSDRVRGSMLPLIARHKNLKAVGPFAFDSYMEKFLIGNPLSSPLEEINPLHLLEQSRRATQMGPGGIGTDNAITEGMQCHDADTEVFTRAGWKRWNEVSLEDELACKLDERLEFHKPSSLHKSFYKGLMYGVDSNTVNFLVTPNHRIWTAPSVRTKKWAFESAEEHYGKFRVYSAAHIAYAGSDSSDYFELAPAPRASTGDRPRIIPPIDMGDWCEFLGWYMAEGSCYNTKKHHYTVTITQCPIANPEKCKKITDLLSKLPFKFKQYGRNFVTGCKSLYLYLSVFGYCGDKYIPDFLFEVKSEYRRRFLDAFCLGDGNKNRAGANIFSTSSHRLAGGLARLLTLAGASVSLGNNWTGKNRKGEVSCTMHRVNELTVRIKEVKPHNHCKVEYEGYVYCASVPGGLLLTRRKGKQFWSGNSIRTDQFGFISSLEGPECIGKGTRVYTYTGWQLWENVNSDTEFACNIDGKLEFHKASAIQKYHFKGDLIRAEHKNILMRVTPQHRVYYSAKPVDNWQQYKVAFADNLYGKTIRVPCWHLPYEGIMKDKSHFDMPGVGVVPIESFAAFMGWFLSEGNITAEESINSHVCISQSSLANPDCFQEIEELLNSMCIKFTYRKYGPSAGEEKSGVKNGFLIYNPQLYNFLLSYVPAGRLCHEKGFPAELLEFPVHAREALLYALMQGDGRINKTHNAYCTTSPLLAEGVEKLMISLGHPCRIRLEPDKRPHVKTMNYAVSQFKVKEKSIWGKSYKHKNYPGKEYGSHWSKEPYDDLVYCATVPGSKLFIRGSMETQPFWSGNSEKIGIDSRMAWGSKIGSDGKPYQRFYNRKTKKVQWMSPEDLDGLTVKLPD
jgi:hypothetical protein